LETLGGFFTAAARAASSARRAGRCALAAARDRTQGSFSERIAAS